MSGLRRLGTVPEPIKQKTLDEKKWPDEEESLPRRPATEENMGGYAIMLYLKLT